MTISPDTKTLKISGTTDIPRIGFGTWQATDEDAYNSVLVALQNGYTHIDTAWIYGNEAAVGRAIKDSGIDRSKLFITTKLWLTKFRDPAAALDKSLELLGLDYVDLYLVHWPIALNPNGEDEKFPKKEDGEYDYDPETDYIKVWDVVSKLPKSKAKTVGVSNYDSVQLEKLASEGLPAPAVNQIELHPYLPQQKLLDYCKSKGITVEAYSPLGSAKANLFEDETIKAVGEKYGISPAQVLISWGAARGYVVLPKSVTPERIVKNVLTVELSDEDMQKINSITTRKRTCTPTWGPLFHDCELQNKL